MVKQSLVRGLIIAIIGSTMTAVGVHVFDISYQSVEPILGNMFVILKDKEILPTQFTNFTIHSDELREHNVIIIHIYPSSGLIKLEGIEPNNMTFEKESKDGFLYHIIERSNQGGMYYVKISNTGSQPVRIDAIMGEDPFLSKNCNVSYERCNLVKISQGMVATGIIAIIIGILIGIYDFNKRRELQKK